MNSLNEAKVVLQSSSEDGCYAEFVANPLLRGFGNTLGNSLRRVLLSSLPGCAANFIRIDGVSHEFSTIPGVREDVSEIVLNIKNVVAKLNNCDNKTVYIDAVGPVKFTSDMIQVDSDIEILSDNLIAVLDENAHLKMEICFSSGVGYVSSEQNRSSMSLALGVIPVDSIYSPVVKVDYSVENTRVGQVTDYDKLILRVWTNGVISASDAVSLASRNLVNHFNLFCLSENNENSAVDGSLSSASQDLMLDSLGLSVRAYNSLKRAGIDRVDQLMSMKLDDIMGIRNLGSKSCDEVVGKLKEFGWVEN